MPNVLVLSFEGFSFSARQLYEQLLPKLLSRAIVHESITIQDALNYILSGWPSVILVTDAVIVSHITADSTPDSNGANGVQDTKRLLEAVVHATKHGCTTILMGFFSSSVSAFQMNNMFRNHFGLRWESCGESYMNLETVLATPDQNAIRSETLTKTFYPEAVYLRKVPQSQIIYAASYEGYTTAFAAFGKVGLGKLGYVGDVYFGYESEKVILAMCHLDRLGTDEIEI